MKEDYKHKYFGESTIFIWHVDLIKGCFFAEMTPKSGRQENVVNDRNINAIQAILQENRQMICEKIYTSINITKTSMFCNLH